LDPNRTGAIPVAPRGVLAGRLVATVEVEHASSPAEIGPQGTKRVQRLKPCNAAAFFLVNLGRIDGGEGVRLQPVQRTVTNRVDEDR
jgi:hypothetical protein